MRTFLPGVDTLTLFVVAPLAAPLLQLVFDRPLFQPPFRWSWQFVLDPPTIVIAIAVASALYFKGPWPRSSRDRPISLLIAMACGIAASFLLESFYASQNPPNPLRFRTDLTAGIFISMFASQLAFAAAMEEPVFRGVLWGYLRERGWPSMRILAFQAFLFWIAHIYHAIIYPMSFWIGVPLLGLGFGYAAWRTRSTAVSMFMHAAANTEGWLYTVVRL